MDEEEASQATETATATETYTATATATDTSTPTATVTVTDTPTTTPTSTSTPSGPIEVNSTCSLADAITAANTDTATGGCPAGSGADTIELTENVTLTALLPQITSEITLEGGGFTIDGDGQYRIFNVGSGGDFTVNNAALINGLTTAVPFQDGGAGIITYGKLTVKSTILQGQLVAQARWRDSREPRRIFGGHQ